MLKTLKKLLFKTKISHSRDFVEIFKTNDKDEANKIKKILEKYKIPVYSISKIRNMNDTNMEHSLRIPRHFENKAKEILQ